MMELNFVQTFFLRSVTDAPILNFFVCFLQLLMTNAAWSPKSWWGITRGLMLGWMYQNREINDPVASLGRGLVHSPFRVPESVTNLDWLHAT